MKTSHKIVNSAIALMFFLTGLLTLLASLAMGLVIFPKVANEVYAVSESKDWQLPEYKRVATLRPDGSVVDVQTMTLQEYQKAIASGEQWQAVVEQDTKNTIYNGIVRWMLQATPAVLIVAGLITWCALLFVLWVVLFKRNTDWVSLIRRCLP